MDDPVETVIAYHERTKHRPGRYARALGYLDWDTQPDPFRRFEGARSVELDRIEPEDAPGFDDVLAGRAQARAAVDRRFVSQLFYDALALSAWKQAGRARWSLRVNPSSGNLHPTEGYLIAGPVQELLDGAAICHYAPLSHALEPRVELEPEEWALLSRELPAGSVLVGLTSIYWREAWKYGERAFRYCHHDLGHAIGSVSFAASVLGWEAHLLDAVTDHDLGTLLGTRHQSGIEAEHPDCLILVCPRGAAGAASLREWRPPAELLARLDAARWSGTPAQLSSDHHEWPIIEAVSEATEKHQPPAPAYWAAIEARSIESARPVSARRLIRQRRSAVDMDGTTALSRAELYRMLESTLPGGVPFSALPWRPRIHLALFVHRVTDLEPGLYFLPRSREALDAARAAFRPELIWEPAPECPDGLDLRLLVPADVRSSAELVACHQEIAANGAFALGMIAEFEPALREHGAFVYRRLHWEAGALGQVLYLEAEAQGMRATGIGCFFDDVMHELLGLADRRFQTLYHFTLGGAVDDPRLRTMPAYEHSS